MKPLVSIVIPTYNRRELTKRAIQSARDQTLRDIEIVVSDNASNDGTYGAVQEIAREDSRVKCVRNDQNIGPVRNWLRGVDLSQGVYTKILFSDDFLEPDAVEAMVAPLIQRSDVGLVWSAIIQRDPQGNTSVCYRGRPGLWFTQEYLWHYATMRVGTAQLPYSPSAALFRKEALQPKRILDIPNSGQLQGNLFGCGNDLMMFLLSCENYPAVYHIDRPLVSFCRAGVEEANQVDHVYSQNPHHPKLAVAMLERAAFAHFLTTGRLSKLQRRTLETGLFVASTADQPGGIMRSVHETKSSLFPDGYAPSFIWWHPRVIGLIGRIGIHRLKSGLSSLIKVVRAMSPRTGTR